MSVTKNVSRMDVGTIDKSIQDLQNDDLYGNSFRRANWTPKQWKKYIADKSRIRKYFDLAEQTVTALVAVADHYVTSHSSLANYLIVYGLLAIAEGKIDIVGNGIECNSYKFDRIIKSPDLPPIIIDGKKIYP